MPTHGANNHDHEAACSYRGVSHPDLPPKSLHAAQLLTGAVHDEGPAAVAAILRSLTAHQLRALAVTLAAMVPVEYSPAELLAWNDSRHRRTTTRAADSQPPLFPAVLVNGRPLQPHGTHAAFNRHRAAREEPCDPCWHGERAYQRDKKRRYRLESISEAS